MEIDDRLWPAVGCHYRNQAQSMAVIHRQGIIC
jgi:hypothetical protein